MLRSLQTDDPKEAWARAYPDIVKLDAKGRISLADISSVLGPHCRGMRTERDTLHWAREQGLLEAFLECIPTQYALTPQGKLSNSSRK